MLRFVVSVVLALAAWLAAYILEGGNPLAMLGLSAFLITFFVPLFGVLAIWSWSSWLRAWRHAFVRADEPAQAQISVEIWKFSEFAAYLAGVLAWMTGAILILGNMEGATVVRLGHAAAAGLIAPLYGVFFGFVCRILRARVESLMAR